MAILEILEYPHPLLRQPTEPVDSIELAHPDFQSLLANMVETMYAHPGAVGLAAPQIGISKRVIVMDSTAKTDRSRLKVVINPMITEKSKWKYSREGCLSFPDYLITVKRARKISLTWTHPEGECIEETLSEFEAIILQHELDHLDGILFIDRMQNPQTDLILRSTLPQSPDE